jgi:Flp pilus assembly protein TadG
MYPASKNIKNLARIARDFIASRTGNVAMMFGLALVPIMICAGVGVDYARMSLQKQQMAF